MIQHFGSPCRYVDCFFCISTLFTSSSSVLEDARIRFGAICGHRGCCSRLQIFMLSLTTACRLDPSPPGVVQKIHRLEHAHPDFPHLQGQYRERAEWFACMSSGKVMVLWEVRGRRCPPQREKHSGSQQPSESWQLREREKATKTGEQHKSTSTGTATRDVKMKCRKRRGHRR